MSVELSVRFVFLVEDISPSHVKGLRPLNSEAFGFEGFFLLLIGGLGILEDVDKMLALSQNRKLALDGWERRQARWLSTAVLGTERDIPY